MKYSRISFISGNVKKEILVLNVNNFSQLGYKSIIVFLKKLKMCFKCTFILSYEKN